MSTTSISVGDWLEIVAVALLQHRYGERENAPQSTRNSISTRSPVILPHRPLYTAVAPLTREQDEDLQPALSRRELVPNAVSPIVEPSRN